MLRIGNKMQLSVQEAELIIGLPKTTVTTMSWTSKNGNYNPKRFMYESAILVESEVREDLIVRMQYRGEFTSIRNDTLIICNFNFSCGLFAQNNRIFAYDFNDSIPHKNTIGKGKPYFGQQIIGLHKHIWTEYGYGYAEPLQLTDNKLSTIIGAFATNANIKIKGGIICPPSEQLSLFS